ncbi:hypothetical protein D5085_18340 [Ectothiorhodospiraceae bacterium BW-2]|nr:hypothetical protein D5085_18340 [Ectothiorhodospiraceae bacterium BW-2]
MTSLCQRLALLLLLPLLSGVAAAGQQQAEALASMVAGYLFELNRDGPGQVIPPYLSDKPQIHSVAIIDAVDETLFWHYPYGEPPSEGCVAPLQRQLAAIDYDGETIGRVELCYLPAEGELLLTAAEQAWLANHAPVRVHNENNWPPFNFNDNGQPRGLSIDLMRHLAEKAGLRLAFVSGEWNELLNQAFLGDIDVMLNIAKTEQRQAYLDYVGSYAENPTVIYARKDRGDISDIDSLNGKKVAVVDGFWIDRILLDNYPLVQRLVVNNVQEALEAVLYGRAEATIGSRIVLDYAINQMMMADLEPRAKFQADDSSAELYLAVSKNNPELHSILSKALQATTMVEMGEIRQRWLGKQSRLAGLSAEQQRWIESHPTIRVGGELDWAPFDFVNESGEHQGLANDYLRRLEGLIGFKFDIQTGRSWNELLIALEQGEIDMLPAIYFSPERAKKFNFTHSYLSLSDYFFTRSDREPIHSLESLYGQRVAVVKGYAIVDWLQQHHPQIELLQSETILEGLRQVKSGQVEAFINDNPSTTYTMEQHFLSGIVINNLVPGRSPIRLHMATRSDYPELAEIISLAIKAISPVDRRQISQNWMSTIERGTATLELTDREREWLIDKPLLRFAVDPNWLPIEAITATDEGPRYEGMMADILQKIGEISSIRFELVPTERWPESVELARTGQVDMLAAVSRTPEREQFLDFSSTTIELNDGVVMHHDAEFISELSDLKGLRVGVPDGISVHHLIRQNHPEIIVMPIKGTHNGVKQLLDNTIDAFIGNLEVMSYIMNQQGIYNLKVALRLDKRRQLHIALSQQLPPEALSVLNKAIAAIPESEMDTIRYRWVGLKVGEELDYQLVFKIGLGVLVVILLILYNNYRLNRLVALKTADIERQKEALRQFNHTLEHRVAERTAELAESEQQMRSVMEILTGSIQYASRIQRSVLPREAQRRKLLPKHFILWEPRDVVGGDIYWMRQWLKGRYIVLGDCTGHGVPGAFMTLIANGAFENAIDMAPPGSPASLIGYMHRYMQQSLGQDLPEGESDDGIELGVLFIPDQGSELIFAGARFSLFYLDSDHDEVVEVKGDKCGIGYRGVSMGVLFNNRSLEQRPGRRFVMSSDGILDQVGGKKRRMMGKKRFKELLLQSRSLPIERVGGYLFEEMNRYRGEESRRDDVSVIGFELS